MKKLLVPLLGLFIGPVLHAGIITGTISAFIESADAGVQFGDGTHDVTLWWSTADGYWGTGYFYGSHYVEVLDLLAARFVTDISQITDASSFLFTSLSLAPLGDADANSVFDQWGTAPDPSTPTS